jgi:hypothetical protein
VYSTRASRGSRTRALGDARFKSKREKKRWIRSIQCISHFHSRSHSHSHSHSRFGSVRTPVIFTRCTPLVFYRPTPRAGELTSKSTSSWSPFGQFSLLALIQCRHSIAQFPKHVRPRSYLHPLSLPFWLVIVLHCTVPCRAVSYRIVALRCAALCILRGLSPLPLLFSFSFSFSLRPTCSLSLQRLRNKREITSTRSIHKFDKLNCQ